MRYAYQTIIYGLRIGPEDGFLETVLKQISEAGFTGVEFAQSLDNIFLREAQPVESLQQLLEMTESYDLVVTGIAGGTFDQRVEAIKSVKSWGNREIPYVYVDNWNEKYGKYVDDIFKLVIHPHVYKNCDRISKVEALLGKHENLCWMPDIAHLAIVGDDLELALTKWPEKMIAVHLKDWDPSSGSSYHRYARGFVGLGRGAVRYKVALEILNKQDFRGWVVVEQDYCDGKIEDCIRHAALSLGILPEGVQITGCPERKKYPCPDDLFNEILRAGMQGLRSCYEAFIRILTKYFEANDVEIWSYDPSTGYSCRLIQENEAELTIEDSLVNKATENSKVFRQEGDLCFPVLNRFNRSHVRFVVVVRSVGNDCDDEIIGAIAEALARAADIGLDDACSRAAGRVHFAADTSNGLDEFLKHLKSCIKSSIQCEGVTIFLADRLRTKLEVHESTGIKWREDIVDNQKFYRWDETKFSTVKAWRSGQPLLRHGEFNVNGRAKSREHGDGVRSEVDNILFVPLVNNGKRDEIAWKSEITGLIRCRNKQKKNLLFSVDDAAIVDTICQAAGPHLELLIAYQDRRMSVARIIHELGSPVNSMSHAISSFSRDIKSLMQNENNEFRFDYTKDINMLLDLMKRIVKSVNIYGLTKPELELQIRSVWFMGDVVAPLVNLIRYVIEERGFDPGKISYDNFHSIPKLYIDTSLFQQVMFNLLSNSIKYSFKDKSLFEIRVSAEREKDYYVISVEDKGPGIFPDFEEGIFEEGQRGPESINKVVFGLGIGLSVVQRIVEAHGGFVRVTKNYDPTTISIFLPISLSNRLPRSVKGSVKVVQMKGVR